MSSAANTFLRLNSTVSQPGSPTSLKGAERVSMVGSVVGGGGTTSVGIGGAQSVTGTAKGRAGRCGSACWRYLSSNPRLRKGLAHAGLVLLLCLYTAAGASNLNRTSEAESESGKLSAVAVAVVKGFLGGHISSLAIRVLVHRRSKVQQQDQPLGSEVQPEATVDRFVNRSIYSSCPGNNNGRTMLPERLDVIKPARDKLSLQGQVFQWLEQPHELEQSTILQNRVVEQRQEMIKLWKDAHDRPDFDQSLLEERMAVYEDVLQEAVSNRVPLQAGVASAHWTYTQSVFFASTVLTTIVNTEDKREKTG
ncbi:hypothetical protein DAPPUDRAFT_257834 [Daphnia pulex]|uniref:Transmembrane protein n=1 Tax=Daphnia pulex TaxID=6669 RepID=E9HEA4_DAPPU|nr:hypothetical protein DAPPUDRAFT_257834 [Daphnia pulex]|eukprot:EFX69897.1 hypothetical protein DAPPUDRAFT_257834 [Daphnia pulex]